MNKIFSAFFKINKDQTHYNVKLFEFLKLKFRHSKNINPKQKWRLNNPHNEINLVRARQPEKIFAGKGSYGSIRVLQDGEGEEKLVIGNYCSIAPDVKFILASDHPYKGISTFPFKVKYLGYEYEAISKGDIIIKDDVWIGLGAIILSGVTIGQGAIVGAGSVVTKDVPPYAIIGGNPAKVIKYRFKPEIIEKLVKFDYSKLTEEKIKSLGEKLYTEITENNIDDLLKEFIR